MNPENLQQDNESIQFLWKRLSEECPTWSIGIPVLFAFLVVGLVVFFRQDKKLMTALIGGAVVGVISMFYLFLAYFLVQYFRWLVILIPVMGVALFYVGMMYLRDAKSVHWLWAIFLGLLRTTVYMILAVVFLMPGCQHFDKQEYESKVIFVFDVSGSMYVVDDLPEEGKDPAKLPSRQDKILKMLASSQDEQGRDKVSFIDQVLAKSPLSMYRSGPVLDEGEIIQLDPRKHKSFAYEDAVKFLKPRKEDIPRPDVGKLAKEAADAKLLEYGRRVDMLDTLKSGTNLGGSLLQMHKLENSSFIQAIVVISDGQSNVGNDDARLEFLNRVNNPKRTIPVFTIGVGQFRMPASIRIDDILAPEETRPDDKFRIRIPVVSTGLQGEKFTLNTWIQRKKDVTGKAVDEPAYALGEKIGEFKGAGDFQEGKIEYEVDLQKLLKIEAKDPKNGHLLEGEWHIHAKTPRHKNEPFPEPFHVSETIKVQVQKRALRVLLFAGGATREYQFLRSILYREMVEKRMEMCIYLQTGREDHIDQDVEPDRLLADFPDRVGPNLAGQKFMSLSDYDVVIAFDPDWERLSMKQRGALKEWVGTHAGGVIFVAGPVYAYKLARPGGQDYSSILSIYPVVLKDSRIHGLGLPGQGLGHDATRPYALNFNPVAKNFDFLKLDETGDSPISGWKGFFWNNEKISDSETQNARPRRGFFTYYPVERIKAATEVAATFAGPKESRIGDKTDAFKDQQPFIASMTFGAGKSLYLGSGELWRLRAYKDGFHERLWIKMARYVAAGATQQKKYGRILMARNAPVGQINFEAQIKGKDLLFLSPDERPTVQVKRIDKDRPGEAEPDKKAPKSKQPNITSFVLQPKPADGDWQGYFVGGINLREPGDYEFTLPIKGLPSEALRATLTVRKPNPELDNVRTNFGYLYQLASDANGVLNKLSPEVRKQVESSLQVPTEQTPANAGKTGKRLFFSLNSADAITKCLVPVPPKTDIIKGRFEYLWDAGLPTGLSFPIFWAAVLTPLVVGIVGLLLLLLMKQWIAAFVFLGVSILVSALVPLFCVAAVFTVFLVVGILLLSALVALVVLAIKQEYFGAMVSGVTLLGIGALGAWYVIQMPIETTVNLAASAWVDWLPVDFSFLLVVVVSLVGIEWLTRKLLRLA